MKRLTGILILLLTSLALQAQLGLSLKGGVVKGSETTATFTPAVGLFYSTIHLKAEAGVHVFQNKTLMNNIEVPGNNGFVSQEYIKIPILISWKPLNTRLYFAPTVGFGINLLTKAYYQSDMFGSAELKEPGARYTASYIAGLKIGLNVSDRIDIEFEGRYELQEINSTSVLAGINYKF